MVILEKGLIFFNLSQPTKLLKSMNNFIIYLIVAFGLVTPGLEY